MKAEIERLKGFQEHAESKHKEVQNLFDQNLLFQNDKGQIFVSQSPDAPRLTENLSVNQPDDVEFQDPPNVNQTHPFEIGADEQEDS